MSINDCQSLETQLEEIGFRHFHVLFDSMEVDGKKIFPPFFREAPPYPSNKSGM